MNIGFLFLQKLLKMIILIIFSLCLVGFKLPDNNQLLVDKPVYVVSNESDYFRLMTISTNQDNNIPILWLSNGKPTDKLENFQKYYHGNSTYLSSQQIDEVILDHYSNPLKVVISDKSSEAMLFASLISSALHAPLFIETIPVEVLNNKNLSLITAVGEVNIVTSIKTEKLDSLEKAQNYYNQLVDKADTAVVISDPEVYSIGAEAAAYHRAKVFFNIEQGKTSKTKNLIWVTLPTNLGQPNFRRLYASDSINSVNNLYTQNIGIITGFSVEDMSLLLARTFAYHDMQGDWKKNIVVASMGTDEPPTISTNDNVKMRFLGRDEFSGSRFKEAISTVNYVFIFSHGSPTEIMTNDGTWPIKNREFSVPPLLFVAEACSTMRITEESIDQSIALKLVSSGAIAFVGSMDIGGVSLIGRLPFFYSTRQTPLGELVRMANSVRMDLDADEARVILIGDPTFYYVKDQLDVAIPIASTHANGFAYEIKNASEKSEIILNIQSQKPIVRAVATLDNGRKINFFPGANYFGAPMGVISNGSGYTVQIPWLGDDGDIIFFDTWSLPVLIRRYFGNTFTGMSGLLQGLTTIGNPWNFPVAFLLFALVFRKRLIIKNPHLILFLIVSLLFSLAIFLFLFSTSWSIRMPITIAMFIWCFISFNFFEKIQNPISKTLFSTLFFLIPFLFGLLITLIIASSKATFAVLQGVTLLGFIFTVLRVILNRIFVLSINSPKLR
ncbi:MAG: hypothetical protein FP831_18990 [Anaerolineae bacterium]|nr:hypothetical protein [Anaerolineae bacterium]